MSTTDEPAKYPVFAEWPTDSRSIATNSTPCSANCARSRASRSSSTTRPAPPKSAAAASADEYPDPAKRVFINELVCEGCGDCGVKSNCVSVQPLETEFGRKREIDQSNCNKDYSCVNGFCPSFVTVHGGATEKPKHKPALDESDFPHFAAPDVLDESVDRPYGILVTGIGGTGVVTIGAILGMAAHLEGKGCTVLDMTGLAQKGGAVTSHVRSRAAPGRHPRHPRRRRRAPTSCSAATWSSPPSPRFAPRSAGRHRRRRQHRRDRSRRLHPRSRLHDYPSSAIRRAIAGDRRWRALRRCDRDSRRRCSAIPSPPTCSCSATPGRRAGCRCREHADARHRTQRRRGRNEPAGVPLGPARRRRARRDREDRGAAASKQSPRRTRRRRSTSFARARRFPDRLSERRLRSALLRARSSACARPSRRRRRAATGLATAAARALFKLMAVKDEYEVARLYSGRQPLPGRSPPPSTASCALNFISLCRWSDARTRRAKR